MSTPDRRPATLVIQTAFLGDVILTTPLLARLARDGPVDVLTHPAGAAVLANNPDVREAIVYDKRGRHRGIGGFFDAVGWLRRRGYRRAIHAQGSLRSAAISTLAGVRRRVGFETSAGRTLYTTRVVYDDTAHHVDRLLALAVGSDGVAGPESTLPHHRTPRPRLFPGPDHQRLVDHLLDRHGAARDPLVGLAPGSAWGTKRWPFYPQLAAALRPLGRPVILGATADKALAAEIAAEAPGSIDATAGLSILESAALVARCRAVVTNDSAPLHLASAMNTPTLAIFGPTVPTFGFGPLADRSFSAGLDALPCRPCDRHGPARCPLGHWRCMRDLAPDTMLDLLRGLLAAPHHAD